MTSDEVVELLKQIRDLDHELVSLRLELDYLSDGCHQVVNPTSPKVSSSKYNSRELALIKQLEEKEKIAHAHNQCLDKRRKLVNLINLLKNPMERTILRLLFVNHLRTCDITDRIERGQSFIYRTRRVALKNLAEILTEESKKNKLKILFLI